MAQFDLKKASVYFEDGHTAEGAVDNLTPYPIGTTTMKVKDFTGVIPIGTTFMVEGDDEIYTVTESTPPDPGPTTQITFTPGLVQEAATDTVIAVGGRLLEMKIGEGNLTYDEKRTMEYKRDRGKLDTVREGDEEPIDVRLDVQWEWLSSAVGEPVTAEEVLKHEGPAVDWISSSDDPCEPFAINIVILYDPECEGNPAERITLSDYRWESLNHDLKAGTLATSGKCNVTRAKLERLVQA